MLSAHAFLQAEIDTGKIRVVTIPALGDAWNDSAQNFAALHSSRLLFLFRGLGMKRAPGLNRVCLGCQRSERTVI
jgi:hypothetical protein